MGKRSAVRVGVGLGAAILCLTLLGGWPGGAAAAEATKYYEIPVVVNIMKDAGVTEQEAKDAVEEANKHCKQKSKVKLVVVKVNPGQDPPPDSGDGLTRAQRDKLRSDGEKELPDGKGVKVDFVKQPKKEAPGTYGTAIHEEPVVIVKKDPSGTERTANTVKHEIGHVLTLADTYDVSWSGNLMYGYTNAGWDLTVGQIAEIQKEAAKRGKVVSQDAFNVPSAPVNDQNGMKVRPDTLPPTVPDWKQIGMTMLNSTDTASFFDVRLMLNGLVPDGGSTSYRLLFNADNNDATGATVAGRTGIDRVVRVSVTGPGAASFWAENPDGSGAQALTGTLGRQPEFLDSTAYAPPETPTFLDGKDVADFTVGKDLLGLTGNTFSVGVVSGDPDTPDEVYDVGLNMHAEAVGPQLWTDVGLVNPATETVTVHGSGFTPLGAVSLLLDDDTVDTAVADGAGNFTKDVALSPDLANSYYFLTGIEDDGGYGFAVITTTPEPATLMMLAVGGLAALRRVRRRAAA